MLDWWIMIHSIFVCNVYFVADYYKQLHQLYLNDLKDLIKSTILMTTTQWLVLHFSIFALTSENKKYNTEERKFSLFPSIISSLYLKKKKKKPKTETRRQTNTLLIQWNYLRFPDTFSFFFPLGRNFSSERLVYLEYFKNTWAHLHHVLVSFHCYTGLALNENDHVLLLLKSLAVSSFSS